MVVNNVHQNSEKRKSLSLSVLNNAGQFDLAQLVDRVIDRFGKHQVLIFLLLCTNSIIVAINHTLTTFHIYTPPEYKCDDETFLNGNNVSEFFVLLSHISVYFL